MPELGFISNIQQPAGRSGCRTFENLYQTAIWMLLITNFTLQFRDFAPWTRLCDRPKFGQIRSHSVGLYKSQISHPDDGFEGVATHLQLDNHETKHRQLTRRDRGLESSKLKVEHTNFRIRSFWKFGRDRILISVRIFIRRPNAKIRSASSQF